MEVGSLSAMSPPEEDAAAEGGKGGVDAGKELCIDGAEAAFW